MLHQFTLYEYTLVNIQCYIQVTIQCHNDNFGLIKTFQGNTVIIITLPM